MLFFLFLSCDKKESVSENSNRTLLVYLGRDNSDLWRTAEEKIESMLLGWNGKNGKLIFYQDLKGEKPCLLEAYRDGNTNKTRIVREYEEENSASAQVFHRVINETVDLYPSESYGLIFFSHASGWLPEGVFAATRSVGRDGEAEMELSDFAQAIPDGLFDFIIFEACFMAGIEVVYELKDKTAYILASSAEILSPGFIGSYETSMDYLFKENADLVSFARNAYDEIDRQYGAYRSGTLSLVRTSGLESLGHWLKSNRISGMITDNEGIQYFDRKTNHLFFDFEAYYSRLLADDISRSQLTSFLDNCLIYKAATPSFMSGYNGFDIRFHSGLTTYIPQEMFPSLNEEYKKMKWYKAVFF